MRTRADGPHKVSQHSESADTHASEGSGRGDVAVELVHDGVVAVALEDQLLVTQLLGYILQSQQRERKG